MLNHKHVDIFKIDIEGWEWPVFEYLLNFDILKSFKQILVEFHDYSDGKEHEILKKLALHGFEMFYVHPFIPDTRCINKS